VSYHKFTTEEKKASKLFCDTLTYFIINLSLYFILMRQMTQWILKALVAFSAPITSNNLLGTERKKSEKLGYPCTEFSGIFNEIS